MMKITRIGNSLLVCVTLLTACAPAAKQVEAEGESDVVEAVDHAGGTIIYLDVIAAQYSSDKVALQELIKKHALVVVDFFAKWCGPCQQLGATLERIAGNYSDVVFIKVDIDKHKEIASENNIRSIPVLSFFKNGQKVHTKPGAPSAADLSNMIQQYLR